MDLAARWRALRKLADDAHDHERERDFFAGEMLALRGSEDKRFGPNADRYWLGRAYQAVSDFGRSILRPFAWWLLTITLFAGLYFAAHLIAADGAKASGCLAGEGHPIAEAAHLSFSKAFVVGGLIDANRAYANQACLYGLTTLKDPAPGGGARTLPDTPILVSFLNALQVLISATLIFLFLMAVRNQFRIR